MALSDERYLRFTTFRRDGNPVSTTVWVVGLGDGQLGFWTSSGSGKAKRLAKLGWTLQGKRMPYGDRGVVISIPPPSS